jgi:tetratricopeptide (TPR) repeat protein
MSDPLRTETSRTLEPASKAERDAKIEQQLLAGLDAYFAGQYEQAINIWTRVLFLDRTHARARAYIERARSAQAERQRESEALLHDASAAVARGDRFEARRLLDAALASSDDSDQLLALRERVERLECTAALAMAVGDPLDAPRLMLDDEPPAAKRSPAAWFALAAMVLVIVGAGVFAVSATEPELGALVERSLPRGAQRGRAAVGGNARELTLLPVPRRAEAALARARALVASGKLRDALPLLESIRSTDPERPDADRMRAEIQHQLLALDALPPPVAPSAPSKGRLP